MMKKCFLLIACLAVCMGVFAQDKKIAISSATASSYHNGEGADKAIDSDYATIWHSGNNGDGYNTTFPVMFTITFAEASHVDYVRYVPRMDGSNGNWKDVEVFYSSTLDGSDFTSLGTYNLQGATSSMDFPIEKTCGMVKFEIKSGQGGWASASEIEAYAYNTEKTEAFAQYFTDDLYTELNSNVTSSDGIADADVKKLVDAILAEEDYKKFRVGEYKAYMTLETLRQKLGVNSYYSAYENPTGIYLKKGESCIVAVSGIGEEPVKLKMKNWLLDEQSSSYNLRNGLNYITALTEGNLFVDYYTDNYKNAPKVKMHFINAPVRGYWDQETMTADDWTEILNNLSEEKDSSILVVQAKHVAVAYPVFCWKQYCPQPAQVDSLMKMYQQILWAERDMLGVEKYKIEYPNRQFSYVVKKFDAGAMAAGGDGTLTPVYSMHGVMTPDGKDLWVWGLAHEFGHTNQINPGLRWSGCIETTNNIYSSWAELHVNNGTGYLRLEDEVMTGGDFKMRGGRMQAYFEEALRKKNPWMLQESQDFYKDTPRTEVVDGIDADGNNIGKVTVIKRSYDHFVKLVPFWQLNLWGTKANKCPDIIPMTVQGIRTQRSTSDFSDVYNTAGKEQMNWMKLACDSAKINLLPFFENAGMLRPIHAHIDSWNIITEEMIADLKTYVANQGYPTPTEEINYINGHNYHIYRDKLKLNVTNLQGELNGDKVKIQHSVAQNAVAFETYNAENEIIRITMYGLGSDDAHSYTQVLFPSGLDKNEDAAYIMAVGYDGERQKVYQRFSSEEDALEQRLGRLLSGVKAILDMEDATQTKVGYYKAASLTELKTIYKTAKEIYDNKTSASYVDAYDQLFAEYEMIVNDEDARIGVVEGYAYRLTNKEYEGRAMSINNEKMIVGETTELSDAQKWYFEAAATDGFYYIKNKSTQTYPNDVQTSTKLYADKTTASEAHAYKLQYMDNGLWALIGSTALHQGSYVYDYGIVGWGADAAASQWYITEVEKDPEVEALIEARYNLTSLISDMNDLIAEVGEVKDLGTKDVDLSEDSYYTNAPCVNTPYNDDKFKGFYVLYDNNPSTFLHTDYSGDAPAEDHYIRMDVGGNNPLRYFKLNYQLRSAGANNINAPTKFAVEGSNDLASWTVIRDITSGLPTESGANHTTELLGDSYHTYRYVRMRVYETSKGHKANEHCYFALSELGLSRIDYSLKINGQFAAMEESALLDAFLAMQKAQETLETAKQKEDVEAVFEELKAQYDALDKARNDAAGIIPVTKITLDKTTVSLVEGESTPLIATVTPDNATNKTVTWSSSNAAVAIVDANGKVTAVAAGEATITATARNCTATCKITVAEMAVSLNHASAELVEGESMNLVATVTPDYATDKTVTWSSSNEAVATVDATGKVTAVAAGKATITATITTATGSNKTAACELTVKEREVAVTSVKLDRDTVELIKGKYVNLTATVYPEKATNKSVTWSSSSNKVAFVKDGKVTAVSVGTAYIIAKAGEFSDTCVVIVSLNSVAVKSIELSETNVSLVEGESITLEATVTPDNATDKTITWSSSDETVATVDKGVVTAKSVGTATITATAVGNIKATCMVTVEKKAAAYVPGDVNNDGLIAINDVVITINKVLGITADNFVFAAADMNGDGKILVNDVVMVINAVLGNTYAKVQATRSVACETLTAIDTDYGFSLSASNATDYVGMQFDMVIPEGVSLKDIQMTAGSNHTVVVNEGMEGVVRVIVTSMTNDAFGLGQLLDVYVSADKDAAIQLTNVYLATQSGVLVGVADEEIVVFRTATDIQEMGQLTSVADIYDLSGRMVKQAATSLDGLQKGVYLMNGKMIMVK